MTLEEKKQEYQQMLAIEYKKTHMEETEGLTLDEIALMNPLSEYDFKAFLAFELLNLSMAIEEKQSDIEYNLQKINDSKTFYQDAAECRSENVVYERELKNLRKIYDDLRKFIPERENQDERGL